MPICITLIKVMQMHEIILLFCLLVTILFHLFHLCNTQSTHWQYNIQPNSHMHYPYQSNANALDYFVVTHAQNNIFHPIWFKNVIIGLFWSYAIPSCLGYISYYLIEQCNTLIWFTLFLLGLCSIVMGVLRLSLKVRVLHGPKNDQSLCNLIMVVLSLKIKLMEYFLSYLEGIA